MGIGKTKSSIRPNIFTHHDYRAFLKEWFQFMNVSDPQFSMRSFAKEVGLSNSLLSLILSGQRPMKPKVFSQLTPHLKLHEDEIEFLQRLVDMADSRNPSSRESAFKSIKKARRFRNLNPNEFEVLEFMSKWYYVAIREMVSFGNFQRDPKWIQDRLKDKVRINEIKKALKFLEEKGFIAYDSKGKAYLPDKIIDCKDGVFSVALTKFHKHMLDQAKDSLDNDSKEERKQIANTTALSTENFEKAKAIIEEAQKKINALEVEQKDQPDRVFYLNFSLFPLARNKS